MSNPSTDSLEMHFRGHNVPRVYRQRVREAIDLFYDAPATQQYSALPNLREALDFLASVPSGFPELTVRQKLVIRKAYLIFKGNAETSPLQLKKDLSAIGKPEPDTVNGVWAFIKAGVPGGLQPYVSRTVSPSADIYQLALAKVFRQLTGRRLQHYNKLNIAERSGYLSARVSLIIKGELQSWANSPDSITSFSRWNDVFPGIDIRAYKSLRNETREDLVNDRAGKYSWAQEPGMKLRLFASPHLWVQGYLHSLKNSLQGVLAGIPEDCHMDQGKGKALVQEHLRKQKTVYCYDLSSATHRFPWSLQLRLCKKMGIPYDHLAVLDWAAKGVYTHSGGKSCAIRWQAGQPLGLYPSFFIFSLTHHFLIRGIFKRLGLDPNGGYVLLGDDVAIFNGAVAKVYQKLMDKAGCEVNLTKSIVSDSAGEFAGAYIDRRNIVNIGKLRHLSQRNLISANRGFTTPLADVVPTLDFLDGRLPPLIGGFISTELRFRLCKGLKVKARSTSYGFFESVDRKLMEDIPLVPTVTSHSTLMNISKGERERHAIDSVCKMIDRMWTRWAHVLDPNAGVDDEDTHYPLGSCVPYLPSGTHKLVMGLADILVRTRTPWDPDASNDGNGWKPTGHCSPIWWGDYLALCGEQDRPFSFFRMYRLAELLINRFSVSNQKPVSEGMMHNRIKKLYQKACGLEPSALRGYIDFVDGLVGAHGSTALVSHDSYNLGVLVKPSGLA